MNKKILFLILSLFVISFFAVGAEEITMLTETKSGSYTWVNDYSKGNCPETWTYTLTFDLKATMPSYVQRIFEPPTIGIKNTVEITSYLNDFFGKITCTKGEYEITSNTHSILYFCDTCTWFYKLGCDDHHRNYPSFFKKTFDFCPPLSKTTSLTIDKTEIKIANKYTVTWSSPKAHSCTLKITGSEKGLDGTITTGKNIFSSKETSGSRTETGVLTGIHTITLECTGILDAATPALAKVGNISPIIKQVKIGDIPPKPTASLNIDRTEIKKGEKATLSWQTTNAESVFIKPGIGEVTATGSLEVSPEYTTRYSVEAIGEFPELGIGRSSVLVKVTVPPKEKPPEQPLLPEIPREEIKPLVSVPVVSPVFTTTLRLGMKNDDVKRLQQLLAQDKNIYPEGIISGNFGSLTQKAVKAFQRTYGLSPDGVADPKTRAKLQEVFAGGELKAPAEPAPISAVFTRDLRKGMRNDDVRRLQQLLAQDKEIYPQGTISGYFGVLTETAVSRFQLKYAAVDYDDPELGMIGPKTRAKLQEIYGQ
jgi:peptidoglycan hydrolase-like protein with peptidoglycan-binding domain